MFQSKHLYSSSTCVDTSGLSHLEIVRWFIRGASAMRCPQVVRWFEYCCVQILRENAIRGLCMEYIFPDNKKIHYVAWKISAQMIGY